MASKTIPPTLFERSRPYFCIIFGLCSFSAAKWQQKRKEHKVEYLTLIDDRLSADAIDCPDALTREQINNEYKFKKVSISGTIDLDNDIIISPRKPPYSAGIKNINTNDPQQLGGYIYSPMITKSGHMVIVNQGWIPKEQLPPNTDKSDDKSILSVCYEGLITPLKAIPQFVKDATNFDVMDTIWPFMDNELLKQRYGDGMDEKEFIVVDVLSPLNETGTFPHRVQRNDLLMVNIPPAQHSVYVWLMCCTGIACFYYSYHFFKHPRSLKRMNSMLYKQQAFNQLNASRNKIGKKQ